MENYSKVRTVEQPCPCPFPGLSSDTNEVRVKDGSKIRNLMRYALSRMEVKPRALEGEGGQPKSEEGGSTTEVQEAPCSQALEKMPSRQIVFTGMGKGVSKAITCVEILKRRVKGLHQQTRLLFSTVLEVWEPLEPAAGLDSLTVSRNIPAIWVLLSRDPLDASLPGYQAPGNFDALWAQAAKEDAGVAGGQRHGGRRKRGGGGGRGKGPGGPVRQTDRSREPGKGQSRGKGALAGQE
ncbi:ribonuclease P protein subunit p25-like protein [Oncorhynchus tshawytscha]|uniref:DNA/RNA-binding protein Alba-like domain-containing protein n=1 Tax=Oncorhynchus tshawytscha TaxID=74940 RepID=A0AAZ3PSA4_ONCTS|nr:ribonuclease P protein subunit p25-like protein [Oncorhynchus tshawytscha]XP_042169808.1 ribonuclease P protein subunit p25-like protein [Oncorhynchus tshawytscha]